VCNSQAVPECRNGKDGSERIWIVPSCSLLHSPCDLDLETNDQTLTPEIKQWLAFDNHRDEVADLERAGIKVIQIDEPAIREGLPLRKADWPAYLNSRVFARVTLSSIID
jgi:hypothetical protein